VTQNAYKRLSDRPRRPLPGVDWAHAHRRSAVDERDGGGGASAESGRGEAAGSRKPARTSARAGFTSSARAFSPLLIAVGVLSDALAGLTLVQGRTLAGLELHLAASLTWIAGIHLLRASDGRQCGQPAASSSTPPSDMSDSSPARDRDSQNAVAALLGLALFPGLGPLACTFALVTTRLLRRPQTPQARQIDGGDFAEPWAGSAARHGRTAAVTRPLIELLRSPDPEAKQYALQRVLQEPGARSISLARCLLGDPDPDMRALAALAVSRLESSLSQALRECVLRCQADPEDADLHADLGILFHQWADKDEAHPAQRRLYLRQARQELEKAVSLGPSRGETLLSLAEVLIALKEHESASDALEEALAEGAGSLKAHLLAMEIAFRERRFDRLGNLAQRALPFAGDGGETATLLVWWIPLQSPAQSRPS